MTEQPAPSSIDNAMTEDEIDRLLGECRHGEVTNDEFERVRSMLRRITEDGAGPYRSNDVYRLIYILGHAGVQADRFLIETFLRWTDDAWVVKAAVRELAVRLSVGHEYREFLMQGADGFEWDNDNDVRRASIEALGIVARDHHDRGARQKVADIYAVERDAPGLGGCCADSLLTSVGWSSRASVALAMEYDDEPALLYDKVMEIIRPGLSLS